MSTCHEVLVTAYRRSGVLPTGRPLTSPDITVGLEYLRSAFQQWATTGMFGKLNPTLKEGEGPYEAEEQEWVTHLTADVITLPDTVVDQGVSRKPRHMSVIVLTNSQTGVTTRYLWDATKADWLDLETQFDLNDYCPLTGTHELAIKTMFAVYLAQEHGMMPDPVLARQFAAQKMVFVGRHGAPRRRDVGSYY